MNVGYRSLLEQVAEAVFALYKRLVRMAGPGYSPFGLVQFGGLSCRQTKYFLGPRRSSSARVRFAKILMVASPRGPSHIGRSDRIARSSTTVPQEQARERRKVLTPHSFRRYGRKELANLFGMMRELAVQDSFARSTFERDLKVVNKLPPSPNGTRPKPRTISKSSEAKAYWHSSANARCLTSE